MAFREVRVFEVREVLRLWLAGDGIRATERLVGFDRKTVRCSGVCRESDGFGMCHGCAIGRLRGQGGEQSRKSGWVETGAGDENRTRVLSLGSRKVWTSVDVGGCRWTPTCWSADGVDVGGRWWTAVDVP